MHNRQFFIVIFAQFFTGNLSEDMFDMLIHFWIYYQGGATTIRQNYRLRPIIVNKNILATLCNVSGVIIVFVPKKCKGVRSSSKKLTIMVN